MEEIARILPKVLGKQPLRRRQPVLEILVPLWPRVAGKFIARFSRPATYHEGILTLAVSSPPWVAQLRELREDIRRQINQFFGMSLVKKVRVRHEPFLNPEPKTSSHIPDAQIAAPPEARSLRLPWVEDEAHLDPEVARIVERSFRKYFSRAGKEIDRWS